jgi:hypothetical protein
MHSTQDATIYCTYRRGWHVTRRLVSAWFADVYLEVAMYQGGRCVLEGLSCTWRNGVYMMGAGMYGGGGAGMYCGPSSGVPRGLGCTWRAEV